MDFTIIGALRGVQTIAVGKRIPGLDRLEESYGHRTLAQAQRRGPRTAR